MDEIMMAAPTREALDAAHLQAMRSMSDQIAMLGRTVEGLARDVKETRDAALRLEAQDLKATIAANRTESQNAIEKVDAKTDANTRAISRIHGLFLPLGIGATALLAFFGEWAANVLSAGPPHSP